MTPLPVVRLELANRRAQGEPFVDAWQAAVATVQGRERDEWLAALRSTAEAWGRAYAGEPLTQPERALSLAGSDLEPLHAARCGHCRKPLPPVKKGRRKFCSDKCRRRWHALRESG